METSSGLWRGLGDGYPSANTNAKYFYFVQDHKLNHPIFYGCFDWHSAVHNHWVLATLLGRYPDTKLAKKIILLFDEQFQVGSQFFCL